MGWEEHWGRGEGGRWEEPPPTLQNRPVGLSVQLGDTSLLNELSQVKQQKSQHNKLPGSWLPVCLRSDAAQ